MNLPIITLLNLCAVAVVFFYAANRLSAKKWTFRQPELWVHTLLVGSSLGVFFSSAWDVSSRELAEVIMNMTTAIYLSVRAWRKKQQNPPKLPFPKYYTKLIKGKYYE